jgi:SAM-dependent methyltransferase
MPALGPAAQAFDAVASQFDARFGEWKSVSAQRRAVRQALLATFPSGGSILELGGGTGEDAAWLAERGFKVCLTDAAPGMVRLARSKLNRPDCGAELVPAEELDCFAARHLANDGGLFDGAFSNFAALNCVEDLVPMARGLARLVKPGGVAMLVLFGTLCPGEMLVEVLRGRPGQALRRFKPGPAPARLGGRDFTVTYHRAAAIAQAMQPWFIPAGRRGIGVFVPPSAAEPGISRHPMLLGILEALDRYTSRLLAPLGDHILYRFVRTEGNPP